MILIVDDDYDIVLLMKLSLEKAGLSVSYFTNPLMALDTFRQTPSNYDLVISDIRMPHLNGYEFVRQIKMIRRDVKVILMSSFELMDAPNSFSNSDIEKFLEMPIRLHKLNEIVLEYIKELIIVK